jgi:hypothetical protein
MSNYRVAVLTFNQGDSRNSSETQTRLLDLCAHWKDRIGKLPEIIVTSVQESKNESIPRAMKSLSDYNTLALQSFWQPSLGHLRMIVCVNRLFASQHGVKRVSKHSGYYRCQWAKGGIFVTLSVSGHLLQFFGLHLPAPPDKPNLRDACLETILKRHALNAELFVAGDLNYRVTNDVRPDQENSKMIGAMTCPKIQSACKRNSQTKSKLCTAANKDQLSRSLKSRLKHTGLRESPVLFCKTCRFKSHANVRVYDPKRYPSWCDRILSRTSKHVTPGEYNTWDLSSSSDHLAVYQLFHVKY